MKMQTANAKRRAATMIVAMLACSATALASDWYVDAVNGSNSNPGTSPSQAWRTITYALATAPPATAGGTQVIHVAPGVYDLALGETFPIVMRDAFQILGDQGRDVTKIDGGGNTLLRAWFDASFGHLTGPSTLIRGFTLQNGGSGVELRCGFQTLYMTVQDCRISGMSVAGVYAVSYTGFPLCGSVVATFTGVEILSNQVGVHMDNVVMSTVCSGSTSVSLTDCLVGGNNMEGISDVDIWYGTYLNCMRTRITGNGSDGVDIEHNDSGFGGAAYATLADCLIDRNGGNGVRVSSTNCTTFWPNCSANVDLTRCTIAENALAGLEAFQPTGDPPAARARLDGSLFYGNGDDIHQNSALPGVTSVEYCDVGDGDFAGSNGNFAADPQFVDASHGDYRLSWSSPCIETGNPSTASGTLDLARNARPIDGDLDTLELFDVGAYEFAPLFMASTGKLGTNLTFELWGPQGNATTVYFMRKPLVAPMSTPFGELDLDPAFMQVYRVTTVGSGPPKFITRPIPNDPSLIGRVFSFQALTDCAAAPNGKAYTNPVELTIVP